MPTMTCQDGRTLNTARRGDCPLPLSRIEAMRQAVQMKREGWSWNSIAKAMARYHGHHLSGHTWRMSCAYMAETRPGEGWEAPKKEMTPAMRAARERATAANAARARLGLDTVKAAA